MEIPLYQVDAFASQVFEGNPAAVCPLPHWPDDTLLARIANENNLSETAFVVPVNGGYHLRWFTPAEEVELCGHATLAAAHVLFNHLGHEGNDIAFQTLSGVLTVTRSNGMYTLDFPATVPNPTEVPAALIAGLGTGAEAVLAGFDYVAVLKDEASVKALTPDFTPWHSLPLRGVLVTAPGDEVDFVSRCFFPRLKVDEDPVTGSAHCELTPYWAKRLNKTRLTARQLSSRPGSLVCELVGDRVRISGQAVDYLKGTIQLPEVNG
ncbi:PhzF family phenazine biosynthesis protein [Shewanella sp. FJAT-52076]|uniref:PhzF family phenazine biosynthesis protein n=1 Tax=Shewanella sp. FJAT-52076 TaxID=2864202 RepID=UPI001C65A2B6|nr:PhzF family phenazine biosynthesis protein [Shewanella sp. FJAT-52076]QYJ74483.1 PhzF family phenazine biosynthesis protein [Shewanella sp. FJAT-52076]